MYWMLAAIVAIGVMGTWSSPTLAQLAPDVPGAVLPPQPQQRDIEGQRRQYWVTDMCSRANNQIPCATVVQIHNQSAGTCQIGVEYYKGFSSTPFCTTINDSLAQGQQATSCSRDIGLPETCTLVCDPPLVFDSGYAIVHSSCDAIGVQATIVTKDTPGIAVTSSRAVNLIALRPPPIANANEGD
jgi:hypothetical protein